MINSNGNLISSFNEIPEGFIKNLHTHLSVLEVLRFENETILFWELHYFRIIAGLRRHRFEIPMNYTMEYLEAEVFKLMNFQFSKKDSALIKLSQKKITLLTYSKREMYKLIIYLTYQLQIQLFIISQIGMQLKMALMIV